MEFKCFYILIYILQDKDTSALCIKLKIYIEYRTFDIRNDCVFPKGEKSPLQVKKSLLYNSLIKHWGMQGNWSALYRDCNGCYLAFNLSPWEICTWTSDWIKKVACSDNDYKRHGCMLPWKYINVPGKSHCELVTSGLHIWSFFFEPNLTISSTRPDCCKDIYGNSLQWKEGAYHRKDASISLLKNAFVQEELNSNNARGEVNLKPFAKEFARPTTIRISECRFGIRKCLQS